MSTSLQAMSEEDYSRYFQSAISSYAKANVDSGRWPEAEALQRAKEAHDKLLPAGLATEDNYFFHLVSAEQQQPVGHIWVKLENNVNSTSAFIYDIEINPSYRRRGYAKSALANIEKFVTELGASSLGLHVFNHNAAAVALYHSVGYQTVSHNMQKNLTQ
ncbi:acetyltransferase (GNAT) family protein [Sinobacterium caligoides]|uniref:Acetyltransferase (GNAT) family protein n=1 Tax=Sinobacterium caligoides TaxID=933926 RepID=A0A3N2DQJ9_9GAMM|nr:GNAT family N-acetyltransferase [Sinobacterium caligoides]ROS02057.1 acetyltransferase (GNAT) family protein [Sinobacterium caligoides]